MIGDVAVPEKFWISISFWHILHKGSSYSGVMRFDGRLDL